jgi:hypothetical protein
MKKIGAKCLFIIRHGERLDKVNTSWKNHALRPHDTPLSKTGHKQAERLGKWLYGKLPINHPITIFSSPFIRCVQTADAISTQLEGLKYDGLYSDKFTDICIEPGLCEDPSYLEGMEQNPIWFLNSHDLMSISHRINLQYNHLKEVSFVKNDKENTYYEPFDGGTEIRLNSIIYEIINHPYVEDNGTAIIITHAKPSIDIIRSLNTRPNNISLPHYEEIKKGNYNGPPVQYTACTEMVFDGNVWDVEKNTHLFSNEHDPRLKIARYEKEQKVTRIVYENKIVNDKDFFKSLEVTQDVMKDYLIPMELLENRNEGDNISLEINNCNIINFDLPSNYKYGQKIIVKYL